MPNLKKLATTTVAAATIFTLGGSALASADGSSRPNKVACAGKGKHKLGVVGLTADGRLICFDEDRPGSARDIGRIKGLAGDTGLVGIDYRPANGALVGLGNAGGVYVLDARTAAATKLSQLDVALVGTSFGIDFNPTVDRLRVVSDTGQNLRINVDTGATTVDGGLTATPPPGAPVPSNGIVGAAYTNNDTDPGTATTLFDIDSALDQVAIQAPPNAGVLNPTGKLGVDTGARVGSDIYSTVRNGTTVSVQAFASLDLGGPTAFYEVDLLTGKATKRGLFRSSDAVIGIAIPLAQR